MKSAIATAAFRERVLALLLAELQQEPAQRQLLGRLAHAIQWAQRHDVADKQLELLRDLDDACWSEHVEKADRALTHALTNCEATLGAFIDELAALLEYGTTNPDEALDAQRAAGAGAH